MTDLSESDFRFHAYERAVQNTEFTLRFVEQEFKRERGRAPLTLREDFAGTAKVAFDFAKNDRRSVAVDHDANALEYGERKHGPNSRVSTYCGDVMLELSAHDVCIAENFSIGYFYERQSLLDYLIKTRLSCSDEGAFFCDLLCGSQLHEGQWSREHSKPFDWAFTQRSFEPLHHRGDFSLELPGPGGKRTPAFEYDWRLYSVPELRDAMLEAGFAKVTVSELSPEKGNAYRRQEALLPMEMSVLYMVAWV